MDHPDFDLIQEIPIYLTKPNQSEFFLARYPSQLKRDVTTISNGEKLKIKPQQKLLSFEVPLFDRDSPLISCNNADGNRLEYFKEQTSQQMEATLQKNNPYQKQFIGQMAEEITDENEDSSKTNSNGIKQEKRRYTIHLTPINGGVMLVKPKQGILDYIDEEEKNTKKLIKDKDDPDQTTDDEVEIIGEKTQQKTKKKKDSSALSSQFDSMRKNKYGIGSDNHDANGSSGIVNFTNANNPLYKKNIKDWKKYLALLDNEDFVCDVPITKAGTSQSLNIRDNELMCQTRQDIITQHQNIDEYWYSNKLVGIERAKVNDQNQKDKAIMIDEDYSKMPIVEIFVRKVFEKENIISRKDLAKFEKEISRTFTDKEIDSFCYRLSEPNDMDLNTETNNGNAMIDVSSINPEVLVLKSVFHFVTEKDKPLQRSFQMIRDLTLIILMKEHEIQERKYLNCINQAFVKTYKDVAGGGNNISTTTANQHLKETKINKYIRDIFRSFSLKKINLGQSIYVWKWDNFQGTKFSESLIRQLSGSWAGVMPFFEGQFDS